MAGVIGATLQDLDTPVLLVDGAALHRNLHRMAEAFRDRKAKLRPHFKNHKCTQIARRQLAAGSAVGITCAKVSEAEALAEAGIENVLIANQVVGARKVERLVRLGQRMAITVAVDDMAQAAPIAKAAERAGTTVGVLIEVDIGMGRCGLAAGEPALKLARELVKLPGLRFEGLQAYEGHLVSVPDPEERRQRVLDAFQPAIDTRRMIEKAGIPVHVISGGSTSTCDVTGTIDGIDEIQAGTYASMGCMYRKLNPNFENALTIAARVISRPKPNVSIVDVGVKGIGHEFGPPIVKDWPTAQIPFFGSEEHCAIRNCPDWKIGDVVELIPSHACTTCNLHREIVVHDEGRVVDVWPIEASGRPS